MTPETLALWASWGAFILSLATIAFSAYRWVRIREKELKAERFQTYHRLLYNISAGESEHGPMKLTSQLAYIFELRNFPEYSSPTEKILSLLREQWGTREQGETKDELLKGIDETLAFLQRMA